MKCYICEEITNSYICRKCERAQDKLFDKDMEWTLIHEKIKMRAPISPKQKDYYFNRIREV